MKIARSLGTGNAVFRMESTCSKTAGGFFDSIVNR
jgi:hypothetical protein